MREETHMLRVARVAAVVLAVVVIGAGCAHSPVLWMLRAFLEA